MRILLDCDGVLSDFSTATLQGIGSDRTAADVFQWDIFGCIEAWHGREQKQQALANCEVEEFWRDMPEMPGAQAFLSELRALSSDIWIVTTSWPACRTWDIVRREWLLQHFQIPMGRVIRTDNKHPIKGDIFIDDKPEHVLAWAAEHPAGRAFLLDAPYNQGHSCIRVTHSDLSALRTP
jgi:5'(3')-deoxyribonucleotidase